VIGWNPKTPLSLIASGEGLPVTEQEWLDSTFDDEGLERFNNEFDQDQCDLDYNGRRPPYEENM